MPTLFSGKTLPRKSQPIFWTLIFVASFLIGFVLLKNRFQAGTALSIIYFAISIAMIWILLNILRSCEKIYNRENDSISENEMSLSDRKIFSEIKKLDAESKKLESKTAAVLTYSISAIIFFGWVLVNWQTLIQDFQYKQNLNKLENEVLRSQGLRDKQVNDSIRNLNIDETINLKRLQKAETSILEEKVRLKLVEIDSLKSINIQLSQALRGKVDPSAIRSLERIRDSLEEKLRSPTKNNPVLWSKEVAKILFYEAEHLISLDSIKSRQYYVASHCEGTPSELTGKWREWCIDEYPYFIQKDKDKDTLRWFYAKQFRSARLMEPLGSCKCTFHKLKSDP
jgi:hypothetical protein